MEEHQIKCGQQVLVHYFCQIFFNSAVADKMTDANSGCGC